MTHPTQQYSHDRLLAFAMAEAERNTQIRKWGDGDNPDGEWLTILAEEFGEVARAMLERDPAQMRVELAQVAAVALAWLEKRFE